MPQSLVRALRVQVHLGDEGFVGVLERPLRRTARGMPHAGHVTLFQPRACRASRRLGDTTAGRAGPGAGATRSFEPLRFPSRPPAARDPSMKSLLPGAALITPPFACPSHSNQSVADPKDA